MAKKPRNRRKGRGGKANAKKQPGSHPVARRTGPNTNRLRNKPESKPAIPKPPTTEELEEGMTEMLDTVLLRASRGVEKAFREERRKRADAARRLEKRREGNRRKTEFKTQEGTRKVDPTPVWLKKLVTADPIPQFPFNLETLKNFYMQYDDGSGRINSAVPKLYDELRHTVPFLMPEDYKTLCSKSRNVIGCLRSKATSLYKCTEAVLFRYKGSMELTEMQACFAVIFKARLLVHISYLEDFMPVRHEHLSAKEYHRRQVEFYRHQRPIMDAFLGYWVASGHFHELAGRLRDSWHWTAVGSRTLPAWDYDNLASQKYEMPRLDFLMTSNRSRIREMFQSYMEDRLGMCLADNCHAVRVSDGGVLKCNAKLTQCTSCRNGTRKTK